MVNETSKNGEDGLIVNDYETEYEKYVRQIERVSQEIAWLKTAETLLLAFTLGLIFVLMISVGTHFAGDVVPAEVVQVVTGVLVGMLFVVSGMVLAACGLVLYIMFRK